MHKQKEKFNRETEVIKDNQMGILELKNTLYEKKYALEGINIRSD